MRLFLALLYIPTCSAYGVSLLVCLHGVCNKDYACFGTAVHFNFCDVLEMRLEELAEQRCALACQTGL